MLWGSELPSSPSLLKKYLWECRNYEVVAMDLWAAIGLKEPCVLACTGAGGKTTVLLSLAEAASERKVPLLLTTTTKMYYSQVSGCNPIFSDDFTSGAAEVKSALDQKKLAAWFVRREGDKVIGVPVQWLDRYAQSGVIPYVLVEADGAQGLLLKAPAVHEPVVPLCTAITVGILNLQAIGQPLSCCTAHRLPLVTALLQKPAGQLIEWRDVALLANHQRGIFQYSQGSKILLLTGASAATAGVGRQIAGYLRAAQTGIAKCVVTTGYGMDIEAIEVYNL